MMLVAKRVPQASLDFLPTLTIMVPPIHIFIIPILGGVLYNNR